MGDRVQVLRRDGRKRDRTHAVDAHVRRSVVRPAIHGELVPERADAPRELVDVPLDSPVRRGNPLLPDHRDLMTPPPPESPAYASTCCSSAYSVRATSRARRPQRVAVSGSRASRSIACASASGIARRHEHAGLAVAHDLRNSTQARSDHGNAERGRLDRRERRILVNQRRQQECPRRANACQDLRARAHAEPLHAPRNGAPHRAPGAPRAAPPRRRRAGLRQLAPRHREALPDPSQARADPRPRMSPRDARPAPSTPRPLRSAPRATRAESMPNSTSFPARNWLGATTMPTPRSRVRAAR